MKRYIHASESMQKKFSYTETVPATHTKYHVQGNYNEDSGAIEAWWSRISPYDDADYVWGHCKANGQDEIFKIDLFKGSPGKKVNTIFWNAYYPEDYESFDEYLGELTFEVAKEIDQYNRKIEPRMMYN